MDSIMEVVKSKINDNIINPFEKMEEVQKLSKNKMIIILGEYLGKKIIIDMNKLKHGLISGISTCRKEVVINNMKTQLRELRQEVYSIDIERTSIEDCKYIFDNMYKKAVSFSETNLSKKKHIFFFIENANYAFNSQATEKERIVASGIIKLFQIDIESIQTHIIISTYSGLYLSLPERFFRRLDFIISGYTPDIKESQYLLGNNEATEIYNDIPKMFLLKVKDSLSRFKI